VAVFVDPDPYPQVSDTGTSIFLVTLSVYNYGRKCRPLGPALVLSYISLLSKPSWTPRTVIQAILDISVFRATSCNHAKHIRDSLLPLSLHNFHCPLMSPLSVDPLSNDGTALIFPFENVSLTEEHLFLSLFKASVLKIRFYRIL
jgi:hypothetical protein